jgi:hypothetical protein
MVGRPLKDNATAKTLLQEDKALTTIAFSDHE